MISLLQTIPGEFRRGRRVTIAFFIVAIIVAYKAAGYIITNDLASLLYIALGFIVFVFCSSLAAELAQRSISVCRLASV